MNKTKFKLFLMLTTIMSTEKLYAMEELEDERTKLVQGSTHSTELKKHLEKIHVLKRVVMKKFEDHQKELDDISPEISPKKLETNNEYYCDTPAFNLYNSAKQARRKKKHNEESLTLLINAHNVGHPFAFREFCENYSIWKKNPKFGEFNVEQEYYKESQFVKSINNNTHNKESLKYLQYAALLGNEYADCEFLEEFNLWKDDPDFSNKKYEKKIEKATQHYAPGYFWLKKSSRYHIFNNQIKQYEFLLKSAQKEHPIACYEYGIYLIEQNDRLEEGIDFIQISAGKGSEKAIEFLNKQGLYFFTEYNRFKSQANDQEKNSNDYNLYKKKSISCLKISANIGYREGCYEYGRYLIDQEDKLKEGRKYIKSAKKKGNEEAKQYMEENPHVYSFHPYVRKLATISSHHYRLDEVKSVIEICASVIPLFTGNKQLIKNIDMATKGISGIVNTVSGISNFLLRGHWKYFLMTGSGLATLANTTIMYVDDRKAYEAAQGIKYKLDEIQEGHKEIRDIDDQIKSVNKKRNDNAHHSEELKEKGSEVLGHMKKGELLMAIEKGTNLANSGLIDDLNKQIQLDNCCMDELEKLGAAREKAEKNVSIFRNDLNNICINQDQFFIHKIIFNSLEAVLNRYIIMKSMMADEATQDYYNKIEIKYGKYARYTVQYALGFLATIIEIARPMTYKETYNEHELKLITDKEKMQ